MLKSLLQQSIFLLFAMHMGITVHAQSKDFNLEDAVLKQYSDFYPKRINQLQWVKESDRMSFIEDQDGIPTLMLQDADNANAEVALSLETLSKWMGDDITLPVFPKIIWLSESKFQFRYINKVYSADLESKSVKLDFDLPEGITTMSFNHDRSSCAYVLEHNIYVMNSKGDITTITEDGKPGIVYGQSVHRNEFGIKGGLFWSPDGNKLAFYRKDETMVDDYPLVDLSSKPARLNSIKYPMAGKASHHVTLGAFDLANKAVTYMNTGEPKEQYLCSVTWAPNSTSIYIALLNRDQNHLQLNRYNASSGVLEKSLFEEKDEKYVEPEHPLWFMPNNPEQFIWTSEKNGFDHLYLYNTDGELLRPLTSGKWEVESILGLDDTKNFIFIQGTGEPVQEFDKFDDSRNGTQRYTYVVDIALGGINIIDKRPGTHMAILNDNGSHLVEHFTSISTPWETTTWTATGKKLETLHTAPDPLKGYNYAKPEIESIISGNGDVLYTRIIKPSDFDQNKKYPVLIYLYGGPHAQLVTNRFLGGAPMWMYWMAEQGYIVATMDNRGSSNRGKAFEQTTFRQLGQVEMTDQKAFTDHITQLPFVDKDRMAIHGWSFGGFMTMNMMMTFPGLFKAGVAGGPVCDWSLYEVMYTERYMDTPETNPDGYRISNLTMKADKLEDDLLVIHGTADNVVVWQHSQSFLKSCIDHQVQLDYFIYPGHPHNIRGRDRYHLMQKVLTYIDDRIGNTTSE